MDEKDVKIAELEKRLAAIEAKLNPPPRLVEPEGVKVGMEGFSASTYAAIDRMSVPRHITRAMAEQVGTDLVRQIVKDGTRTK